MLLNKKDILMNKIIWRYIKHGSANLEITEFAYDDETEYRALIKILNDYLLSMSYSKLTVLGSAFYDWWRIKWP